MGADWLAFGVLGALEVRRDGAPLALPSARQRAVLAALLVRAGRPVPGDALVEAVWASALPTAPRAALHTLLSRLRGVLGADTIRAEPAGYRLAVDPDALDAARFETLIGRAAAVSAREALSLLDVAHSLWRGSAYAEFADHDFARAEAVRLDELRAGAVEDRAALLLELDDTEAVVATLEPFCGEHPLRGRARGQLMTALYRTGRAVDALDRYRDHARYLARELGLEPSPALSELHERILRHELPGTAVFRPERDRPAAPPWLVTDTAFLGRDDDVADLVTAASAHRLVTVTGVGGVGKTRLVAEVLPTLTRRLGLSAVVVELADVDLDHVEVAIAAALDVGLFGGDLGEAVCEYLSVTPLLLVLDNCEHVVVGVQRFAWAVLRRCPGVRMVATSRRRIGLTAEQVLPLEPLSTPPPDADDAAAELSGAMRLFADRLQRIRPSFPMTVGTVAAAAEVCRNLDGLPLAIELAATRAATLGVEPLRARLDQGLDLLTGDVRRGERSLRAALDWSYGLLDDTERALFATLGVFEADFDIDGVERVAGSLGSGSVGVALSGLVDASLVVARSAAGGVRYRLLEIVRSFARERLAEIGLEPEIRMAHAQWVRSLVQEAVAATAGPGSAAALVRLDAEIASIRAAASWALRTGEVALAGEITGAAVLATVPGHVRLELVGAVHRVAEHPAAGVLARAGGAYTAMVAGDLDAAENDARVALSEARTVDERFLVVLTLSVITLYRGTHDASRRWCGDLLDIDGLTLARRSCGHSGMALAACYDGDLVEARRHAAAGLAAAEAAGADAYRAFASYTAAEIAAADDLTAAVPLLAEAARDADGVRARFPAGLATTALVAALTRLGRGREALDLVGPLLDRWLRLATWPQLWTTLRILAELLDEHERPETAALLLAAADTAPSAPAVTGEDVDRYGRLAASVRGRVGSRALEKIDALAAVLSRAQVVERARAAVDELRAP